MDTLKVYSIVHLMHFILKETEHIENDCLRLDRYFRYHCILFAFRST
jgi:hypothetical protein